ncbi:MAG: ribulose-phosphate 3-epimerase [Candidatus Aminicenantes bacterium]|nr:ribulose-phosphate 3-epimerase [Candidatus Aminicenantes bacterium]
MVQIAPSILSTDYADLGKAVKIADKGGADAIHIDIMDGHFVPNLTFGPKLVEDLSKITDLPLDVHLMVDNPREMIPKFSEAGADWVSIQIEATAHAHKDITMIKELGKKAGVVLNPATPIHMLNEIITEVDYVLIMSVNPGWGGQEFIETCYNKISQLNNWINGQKLDVKIEVDGGVKLENMERVVESGADILVMGSAIYNSKNPIETLGNIKRSIQKYNQK